MRESPAFTDDELRSYREKLQAGDFERLDDRERQAMRRIGERLREDVKLTAQEQLILASALGGIAVRHPEVLEELRIDIGFDKSDGE